MRYTWLPEGHLINAVNGRCMGISPPKIVYKIDAKKERTFKTRFYNNLVSGFDVTPSRG